MGRHRWFRDQVIHEGIATLQSSDGSATITGRASVHFRGGRQTVAHFDADHSSAALFGFAFGGTQPTWSSFHVSCDDGTYSAAGPIYMRPVSISCTSTHKSTLEVRCSQSMFIYDKGSPAYLAAPLTNFVADFTDDHADLIHNPLRNRRPQKASTANRRTAASRSWRSDNRLIVFNTPHGLGFIERLPDYDKRVARLISSDLQCVTTSILVIPCGDSSCDSVESAQRLLPMELALSLSLATGTEVEFAWVEGRDAAGHLLHRFDFGTPGRPFQAGPTAIDGTLHRGLGPLLSSVFIRDSKWRSPFGRAIVRNILRGGRYSGYLEERLAALFRALEAFCDEYGIARFRLLDQVEESRKPEVSSLLERSANSLKEWSADAQRRGQSAECDALSRMADKVRNVSNYDEAFGVRVAQLIRLFGLADGQVIDAHFSRRPRADGRLWASLLSMYRASVTHEGFLKMGEAGDEHDRDDAVWIWHHLHDILVRLMLKLIGYPGTYQPSVPTPSFIQTLDWVQPDTPIEYLGVSCTM